MTYNQTYFFFSSFLQDLCKSTQQLIRVSLDFELTKRILPLLRENGVSAQDFVNPFSTVMKVQNFKAHQIFQVFKQMWHTRRA